MAYLPGGTKARKLLVENSVKYLRGLERDAQDSPQLQRDLANAYDRLGDVQGDYIGANVGDTQGAIESYRRALNLQRGLVKHNPTIEARRELLRSCVKLSELLMGQSAVAEALPLAREGAELADTLLQDKAATSRDRRYAAAAYMNFGWAQGLSTGEIEPGMKLMEKARELHQQLAAEDPKDADAQRNLAVVEGRIGDVYSEGRDEPAKAMPYYERALSLIEPIAAANPDDAELQRGRAFVLGSIADLQNDLQRPREGLANYQRALDILEPLRAADPDDQLAPLAVAFMLNGRGSSHLLLGDAAAASARLQSRGNDRAQWAATAADRHRRDSHAARSHVREPCARHRRDVEPILDTEAPARQLRARSSRLVASRAGCSATVSWRRARRPSREARHHRDECSHCCASSRLPKIRIWIRGLSLSIWNIRAKPN